MAKEIARSFERTKLEYPRLSSGDCQSRAHSFAISRLHNIPRKTECIQLGLNVQVNVGDERKTQLKILR